MTMTEMRIIVVTAEMIEMNVVTVITIASKIKDWPACYQNQMCLLQST